MRKPAKILLAGTLAAIAPCGVATSQTLSGVLNDQVQLGDVFADQTLDVVEVDDQTTAVTTATGNNFNAAVEGGDLDVRSNQALQGSVGADTRLTAAGSSGASTVLSTAASGNIGDAAVADGVLTGVFTQTTGQVTVRGYSQMDAAHTHDVSSNIQALGNSQGVAVNYGSAGVRVTQVNDAEVDADGAASVGHVTGEALFSASASANNVTADGAGGSSQRLVVDQQNQAEITWATQTTYFDNAYLATTQATATGNNLSAMNEGELLDVTATQLNTAYLRAETSSFAAQFGAGSAIAYGVGNSSLAGNLGPEVLFDNDQTNVGGGIDAVASYGGVDGYDGSASATAIGNASTAYACSDCSGTMNVVNRQVNSADIGAQSSVSISVSARSVTGTATAIGNSASYFVSQPGQ